MEALQNPPTNGLNGYRMANGHDGIDVNHNHNHNSSGGNDVISEGDKRQDGQQQQQQVASLKQQQQRQSDSPSSLQNFPLGSKRKEIKSVKGVLNSGMNAPLNGGSSRSRPSSTPGSPLVEPRLQVPSQQQQQQQQQLNSQAMNGLTSAAAAAARSAKVKSDLLMGLNSPSIRSDRYTGGANVSESSQYGMNGYGQPHSPMMGGGGGNGPPPGLGMPNGNHNPSNPGSPYSMSNTLGRQPESSLSSSQHQQSRYGTSGTANGKPLDVATMMNALDFFGPGQASSLMMSSNWSSMTHGHPQQQQYQQQQQQPVKNSGSNTSHSSPSLAAAGAAGAASGAATARSVEDLELQVINAKMETQMLENQLNAVIKRNRRKLYA
ncbi:hypothetical protein BGZ95_002445 [Linnemannia exigua]|uniref:Uncharacterized protein n=1 Tax=Linnemannia exigua TaxID=604196 RepID=A0AAD4H9G2_9FUNG|nr:hypothetical protein BGZ95_002445 [Linnemannia exigua]